MAADNTAPVKQGVLPVEQVDLDTQDASPTHPLDALTPVEVRSRVGHAWQLHAYMAAGQITALSYALRTHVAEHRKDIKAVKFINCNLIAPPKRDVLATLGVRTEPGKPAERSSKVLPRRAESDVGGLLCLWRRANQWCEKLIPLAVRRPRHRV